MYAANNLSFLIMLIPFYCLFALTIVPCLRLAQLRGKLSE